MVRARKLLSVLLATALTAAPVLSQDAADKPADKSDTAQETERLKERAALERARADVIAARLEPLTGAAGEGKVTLGEGAGQIEAWLLSSEAVGTAARLIAGELKGSRYIVLAGDEQFSLKPLAAFAAENSSVQNQLDGAVGQAPASCGGGGGVNAAALPLIPLIGSIAASLRTDTEVRGISVDAKDRLLATAIARELKNKMTVPSSLTNPDPARSAIVGKLATTRTSTEDAAKVAKCLAAVKKPTAAQKESSAQLGVALTRAAAFQTALGTPDASGSPPLANLLALEALSTGGPRQVRVYLDKANGTLLTRRNLWTALGAPAVAVSGGVVASFIATNPASGQVTEAGLVRCTTRLAGLRSIQNNTNSVVSCRIVPETARN